MKKASLFARYLLALMLLVFGLNKFLGFMPSPDYSTNPEAMAYMIGLSGAKLFPALGIIYLISAFLLAVNKMVGLATVSLAAVAFNILLFHLALDPANIAPGLIFTVLLAIVMIGNKSKYEPLLS